MTNSETVKKSKKKPLKQTRVSKTRNIGIAAHIDAGKTTLTERILFYSGKIHKMGEVHTGEATMDFDPQEQERGITISSAVTSILWNDFDINLIDTPGHVDFTVEVERSLRVLDGMVAVFDAVEGVEPQSETVWSQANRYKVPRLAFINKMDRIGANFKASVQSIEEKLGARPIPVQIPVGSAETFQGIIDLVRQNFLLFEESDQAESFQEEKIPEEFLQESQEARAKMIELLANVDDTIAEFFLQEETPPEEEIHQALRRVTIKNLAVPVLVGSALKNKGVQPLLDAVIRYLPSPIDLPPISGISPKTEEKIQRELDSNAPFCALAFKVQRFGGRKLVFFRVYSGKIKEGDNIYNPRLKKREKISRLFSLHAQQREKLGTAEAGDIVAAMGLKESSTGDTLCVENAQILLEAIPFREPVISFAVEAESQREEEKLTEALDAACEEDPTLRVKRNEDTGQLLLAGMGELHLEVVLEKIQRDQSISIRKGHPQVVLQETITQTAKGHGLFEREVEEETFYAEAEVAVEPRERDSGVSHALDLPETTGSSDPNWVPQSLVRAAFEGIKEASFAGAKGYPLVDTHIRLIGLKYREKQSTIPAVKSAVAEALHKALRDAKPALLEPIVEVTVVTPEESFGEILGDLNARRGQIQEVKDSTAKKEIIARLPLRRIFGYSTTLRSLSQGRANFSTQVIGFDLSEE